MSITKQEILSSDLQLGKQSNNDDIDYALVYAELKKKYQQSNIPVEVDFRKLVSFQSGKDRFTHLFHAYPAKLLLNIPYFFLNCSSLAPKYSNVLDPFCGSGTVLVESILSGKNAIGADANPLARLITEAKTTPLQAKKLTLILENIISSAKKTSEFSGPQKCLDWDYWYSTKAQQQLGKLSFVIQNLPAGKYRTFFEACFSACSRKVSYADPLISVPVRLNPDRYKGKKRENTLEKIRKIENVNVFECFIQICQNNIKRVSLLYQQEHLGKVNCILNNARDLNAINSNSIDLIITSPPYAGAQKYIRSSSLNIGWLSLSPDSKLRNLEKQNIGREHYYKSEYKLPLKGPASLAESLLEEIRDINPLRAHIASNYLVEMQEALKECYRVLKEGSVMVLVVGNNMVCGKNFETQKYLQEICEKIGFSVETILRDNIHSRGLMTKRNKTASVITCEWILVFRK